MYRHEAIALLRKHQQQCAAKEEIKPWMVDAVLEADKLAHADMGIEVIDGSDNQLALIPVCPRCNCADGRHEIWCTTENVD